MPTDNAPKLTTIKAVALALGCHPETVRREIARGHMQAVRVGKLVRIPVSELERIVSGQKPNTQK